jgi:hypothetical protein
LGPVVVNRDGWIVTAGHILRQWIKLAEAVEQNRATVAARAAIEADTGLSRKERAKALSNFPQGKDDSTRCSAWWGGRGELRDMAYFALETPDFGDVVDIGVGRLEPFDPASVANYAVFKDPTKNFQPGASLCKLGFPFHSITPTWDDVGQQFVLPPGALPMPRFPIEGIFTRTVHVDVRGLPQPLSFPASYVETSTPGLKGQSGGPIFDINGTVWAIQAKTTHYDLGFAGAKQYLNVGMGVHPETIFGVFKDHGITFTVSNY